MTIRPLLTGGESAGHCGSNRARLLIEKNPSLVTELAALTADEDWLAAQRAVVLLEKLAHDHAEWIASRVRTVVEQGAAGEGEAHPGPSRRARRDRFAAALTPAPPARPR